jgi:hypothetical protein
MRLILTIFLSGVCAAASTAALAQSSPVLHAGEWRTRNGDGPINLICESGDHVQDQATLDRMMKMRGAQCEVGDLHRAGPVTTFSTSCHVGGGQMRVQDTITWQGPDSYAIRMHSHMDGGSVAMPDMDITQVAQRVGPCRPGDRPSRY